MIATPLGDNRLRLCDHRSALWWLGVLYRRPEVFKLALKGQKWWRAAATAAILYLHCLPYLFIITLLGRLAISGGLTLVQKGPVLDNLVTEVLINFPQTILHVAVGIAVGIARGIAFGIAGGIAVTVTLLRAYYHPIHLFKESWPNCMTYFPNRPAQG